MLKFVDKVTLKFPSKYYPTSRVWKISLSKKIANQCHSQEPLDPSNLSTWPSPRAFSSIFAVTQNKMLKFCGTQNSDPFADITPILLLFPRGIVWDIESTTDFNASFNFCSLKMIGDSVTLNQ